MLNRWIVIEDLFIYLFIAGTVLSIFQCFSKLSHDHVETAIKICRQQKKKRFLNFFIFIILPFLLSDTC